jgi:cytochrome o ubiquinol oxidase operon protein cyoD
MSKAVVSHHEAGQGSVRSYSIGFGLSLLLTLSAYAITVKGSLHGWGLIYLLSVLAVTQLTVQLICFLHVGRESKPRWNLTALLFAVMVVLILVFGSLWIMNNLQYNHGKAPSTSQIIKDEGYKPSTY